MLLSCARHYSKDSESNGKHMDSVPALMLVETDNNIKNDKRTRKKYLIAIITRQRLNTVILNKELLGGSIIKYCETY